MTIIDTQAAGVAGCQQYKVSKKPGRAKIGVVGCGRVGLQYAYALMQRGLARELVLVDIVKDRALGEAMDLADGVPFVSPIAIHAGDYADLAQADLVVVTAGKRQSPGQSRIDLAKDNIQLFKEIISQIVKHAPEALLLIASNPVDILSYAAYKISGKPAREVIGSGTVLDTARLRQELADHCNIDARNVHAYILGEHGDTEFAVWSKVMIGGVHIDKYCTLCADKRLREHTLEVLHNIFLEVRNSAYNIIQKKGETSLGIGLALTKITEAIIHDENAILPVSSLLEDYQGIKDVYLSVPTIVNRQGVRELLQLEFNELEHTLLTNSANALKTILKDVL